MRYINIIIYFIMVSVGLNNQDAYAYPNYIRLGYHSCIGCHYSPAGGGMLTPYGKGIASTQSLYGKELSDEEEEKLSSQKYFQAFQARLLDYKTPSKNRIFPMEADYSGRLDINSQFKSNLTIAVAPKPQSETSENQSKTYQRVYAKTLELNYVKDNSHLFYFGISPLALGIGLVDHTNYVRSENRLEVTDIPINFKAFVFNENYTYQYFLYLPHFLEKKGNAEKGLGGNFWYLWNKNFSTGLQALSGNSQSINRNLVGLLLKTGIKQYSYLGEINYTHRKIKSDNSQFGQVTFYNQFSYHPSDWSMISYALSGLSKDRDFDTNELRHSFMGQIKFFKSTTLMYEARLRNINHQNELYHLLQAYFNWW